MARKKKKKGRNPNYFAGVGGTLTSCFSEHSLRNNSALGWGGLGLQRLLCRRTSQVWGCLEA